MTSVHQCCSLPTKPYLNSRFTQMTQTHMHRCLFQHHITFYTSEDKGERQKLVVKGKSIRQKYSTLELQKYHWCPWASFFLFPPKYCCSLSLLIAFILEYCKYWHKCSISETGILMHQNCTKFYRMIILNICSV
jgi:hypothetical protein